MKPNSKKNISIQINGLVQGVGFRPFVYRTAIKNGISGWVKNRQDGVAIAASGSLTDLESFVSDLKNRCLMYLGKNLLQTNFFKSIFK